MKPAGPIYVHLASLSPDRRHLLMDGGDQETVNESGGAERDRTADLMLAKHALSQLSYSPTRHPLKQESLFGDPGAPAAEMVGLGRVELPTSPLSGVRSNQLSYRPSLAIEAGRSPAGSCAN